jgi:prepilin-type N-terminal cleavage/methylation domain-containing protein
MRHRTGVTLIEVLVSIFIMGVGLLAILTLFPLGAYTMAQAVKDQRCAEAAANADAIAIYRDMRNDATLRTALQNPGSGLPNLTTVRGALEGPSYPVYVDPIGWQASRTNKPLGRIPAGLTVPPTFSSPGVPRRNSGFTSNLNLAVRWCSLHDDMEFTEGGLPKRIGTEVQREPQYTWAYLFRRPDASVQDIVDMTVVVYSGRPLQVVPDEDGATYGPVAFQPDSNDIEVRWNPTRQQRPPVRKGGWVLDATVLRAANQPEPHGFFYRVVNVADLPRDASGRDGVVLTLQTRPKKGTVAPDGTPYGVLTVMEYVAEVFEKAGDWKP